MPPSFHSTSTLEKTQQVETVLDHPLPAPDAAHAYNYPGSEGFQHQIAEVQACLTGKLLESPNYPHSEMVRDTHLATQRPTLAASL